VKDLTRDSGETDLFEKEEFQEAVEFNNITKGLTTRNDGIRVSVCVWRLQETSSNSELGKANNPLYTLSPPFQQGQS